MTAVLILLVVIIWLLSAVLAMLIAQSPRRDATDPDFAFRILAWPVCTAAAFGGVWLLFATIAAGVRFGWNLVG